MVVPESKAPRPPQKRFYRQRAHSNPIADHCFDYPSDPTDDAWARDMYPNYSPTTNPVRFADVGCGYGGLLVRLSPLYPDRLMLGIEIRVKVSDYVSDRVDALRAQNPGQYNNIGCVRSNAMKHLPNFFAKGQLEKMFFLYPDPHFKRTKHKWRIINETLLAEYAYVMTIGGRLYTVTDVEELHHWMSGVLDNHPLFERCTAADVETDPVVPLLFSSTEEGHKVDRTDNPRKWSTIHVRVDGRSMT